VSGHKFKIGQLVNYRGRDRASGVYQVTQLLAVESYGMSFDYNAPAELFLAKRTRSSRENYRRFATAAEAIRYAVETLRTPKALGAWLQVGDERFNSTEIERLYEALRKPE
jgi:hypothetical protein